MGLARNYRDTNALPRRFDIHGILILHNDADVHSRLHRAIRRMHPNFGAEGIPREKWPLFRRGRPALAKKQYNSRWATYCAKRPDLWPVHQDVTGDVPFMVSKDVNFTTKTIFQYIRDLVEGYEPH